MRLAHSSCWFVRVLAALLLSLLLLPAVSARPLFARPKREGEILKIFDRSIVYVVTNDDAALADALLEGCRHRERRVFSLEDWRRLPEGARWYVSTVFLINRERLPIQQRVPDSCLAEGDEVWTQAVRMGRSWGIAHDVTVSAPDSAWLRRAVEEFRQLKEPPRHPIRRNVRSLAVVPVGANSAAVDVYLKAKSGSLAHLLPVEQYEAATPRLPHADEVLLVDRSALGSVPLPSSVKALITSRAAGSGETVVWRERKASGRARVIVSAPNTDLLAAAVRRYPDPLLIAETPTVVATARDLRGVRRVAVAGVRGGVGGPELARRLASAAATEVRALDAFEVLERAGLSEVLGEIALDQAGITRAKDRARVRQLAAADALLIVEVTGITGRTDYSAAEQRLTPRMERPPRRPLEPSRLRFSVTIPGKEDDPIARALGDVLLRRAVGVKGDDEYKDALDYYNTVTLPRWQRQVDDYNRRYRWRRISWRQSIVAKSVATVSGSLRLVDLVDGLVLWEAPFTATEQAEEPHDTRTVTSIGEDSSPAPAALPEPTGRPPGLLVSRAADTALTRGITALRGTALLPTTAAVPDTDPATVATDRGETAPPTPPVGRLLDIDGDTLLIGLGAGDGIKAGDLLRVRLPDDRSIRVVVTRVRPRTCDAAFEKDAPSDLRAVVAIGQTAAPETGK